MPIFSPETVTCNLYDKIRPKFQFHEEEDCSAYCCLSDVKRWAYVLSEHICFDLKISLVQGKHFPMGVETPSVPVKLVQHNDSSNKENIAVALQHCVQTINSNANFDLQEPDPWPNVTPNITAKGDDVIVQSEVVL